MRLPALVCVLCLLPTPALAVSRTGLLVPEIPEVYHDALGRVVPLGPTTYALRKGKKRVLVAPDPRYLPGAKLRVRGTMDLQGTLVPDADVRGVKLLKMPPQTPAFPQERLLVLPVKHPGSPPTKTRAELQAAFDHMAFRIGESSYGHTQMTVTVLDWQTTPLVDTCDYGGFFENAFVAHDAFVDYRAFTLIHVVEADGVACTNGGGGYGGGVIRLNVKTPDGTAYVGTGLIGNRWAPSIHGFGHSMNLSHANGLDCAAPGMPEDLVGCTSAEYGDPFSCMGQALGDFHVLHKRQLGWLRAIGPETVKTVTTTGTYVIEPLEVPALGLGPKGLFLPMPTLPATWLVLEARQNTGLDRLYPDNWFDGVLAHASVSGVALPNGEGAIEMQGPYSSHFLWPTTAQHPDAARIPTGGGLTIWPWLILVQARDPSTRAVTVEIIYLPDCCVFVDDLGYWVCFCV